MQTAPSQQSVKKIEVQVVDCDVHPSPTVDILAEYVPEPFRSRYFRRYPAEVESGGARIYMPSSSTRVDAMPAGGGPEGSDPALMDRQLLQELGVDYAILIPLFPRLKISDPGYETAMCAACNAWQAETWLSKFNDHGRYRGSIRVCPFDPEGAVREIDKWAGHPYLVQVSMFPESPAPYGQPQFEPVLQAIAKHGLPLALHIIKQPSMRSLTPAGFPSYWIETFAQHPLLYMGHLSSFVFEGTFEKLPKLRVVCVEGGFSWLLPFLWRLDRYWEALGPEVPHVKRRPSEYIREHVLLTTQPLEEAAHLKAMHQMMDWMDAGRLLMLATDYPHYDMDVPAWTTARIPTQMRSQILRDNAIELYRLPRAREAGRLDAVS
jgi:uncharacterized protein